MIQLVDTLHGEIPVVHKRLAVHVRVPLQASYYFMVFKLLQLGKLTVAMLKEAARNANIPCLATRKADIIDAIRDFYKVNDGVLTKVMP